MEDSIFSAVSRRENTFGTPTELLKCLESSIPCFVHRCSSSPRNVPPDKSAATCILPGVVDRSVSLTCAKHPMVKPTGWSQGLKTAPTPRRWLSHQHLYHATPGVQISKSFPSPYHSSLFDSMLRFLNQLIRVTRPK